MSDNNNIRDCSVDMRTFKSELVIHNLNKYVNAVVKKNGHEYRAYKRAEESILEWLTFLREVYDAFINENK